MWKVTILKNTGPSIKRDVINFSEEILFRVQLITSSFHHRQARKFDLTLLRASCLKLVGRQFASSLFFGHTAFVRLCILNFIWYRTLRPFLAETKLRTFEPCSLIMMNIINVQMRRGKLAFALKTLHLTHQAETYLVMSFHKINEGIAKERGSD